MTEPIESQLETLIKARYTVLWLETYEELRATKMFEKMAISLEKHLLAWTNTTGLTAPKKINDEMKWVKVADGTEDPLIALERVESYENAAIIVFKDLHRPEFLENDAKVYRKLRDLHESLKASGKTIVILSPVVRLPMELQKSVTVINMPLPNKEELDAVLQESLEIIKKKADEGDRNYETVLLKIKEQLDTNGFKESVLSAGLGLTLNEFQDVVMKSIVAKHYLDLKVIIAEKEQIIKKSGILEFHSSLAEMRDVGGLEVLKDWIQKRKKAFSKKAQVFGIKTPKGVLLVGLPGTGKSLMAKVSAMYMEMPLLRFDVSKVFASHIGESEQNISQALKLANAVAPCVLWMDEVEKALSGVQSSGQLDSGVTARIFGTLLTWMQEHEEPVFLVCTCNNPNALPPEFMRAGRFDEIFFVPLPNVEERKEIFEIHIGKVNRNPKDFDTEHFAKASIDFSGAEIEAIIQQALNNAFKNDEDLTDEYILAAIDKLIPLSKKRQGEMDSLSMWGKENAVNASAVVTKPSAGKREVDL